MIRFLLLLISLATLFNSGGYSQASFILSKKEVCLNEQLSFTNTSINAESYIWDFSFSELENPGISQFSHQITGANRTDGIDIIHENGEWIGFVTDRITGLFKRLEFGNNLSNTPEEFSLGVVGVSGNGIRLLKEAGRWYALMPSYSNGNLYRLTFGENIKSTPTIESLGNISAWSLIRGSDLIIHNDSIYSVISAYNNDKVTIINFGTSITNSPVWHRDIQHSGLIDAPVGLSLYSDISGLYCLISSHLNQKVVLVHFNLDLTKEELYEIQGIASPTDVELVKNGDQLYGIILTAASRMYKLNFGNEINTGTLPSAVQIKLEGDALQNNTWCFRKVRTTPDWKFFVLQMTGNLKQIYFEDQNLPVTNFEPQNISYTAPGTYPIELTAFDSSGNFDAYMETVVVRDATAPTTTFTTENACIDNENTFTASSSDDASITSWTWDFGDGSGTASGQNVSHQFLNTGHYEVQLSIDAANGCSNTAGKTISIYNPPSAAFTYTSGVTCSNSPLSFSNNTVFHGPDAILTYSWNMDDEAILDTKNPAYTFVSGGDKTITLSAGIPGCTNTQSQTVSITPGPLTNFSFNGSCAYDNYQFTNATTGDNITGYQWNFGDGYASSVASPSHLFSSAGTYVVSLTTSNASGCNTSMQQVVPVNYIPQLNFTNDLACSENSVTFYDQSSVTNANITGHFWTLSNNFIGFSAEGFGSTPTFSLSEAGEYTMTLIGISNYGCADTLVRQGVNVKQSPVADFTYENHCFGDTTILSQAVVLPDGVSLFSVDWLIDGLLLSGNELKYKFPRTGSQGVEMFVRGDNLCAGSILKPVEIIPLPVIDMHLSARCEDQPVLVSAEANSGNDPVQSYGWSINGKPVSSQQNFTYTFKNPDDYAISLLVTTANNCVSSLEEIFTINPSPVSEFEVFPSIGASPLVVQFTDRSKGATSVLYDFSKFNDDQNSSFNPAYTYINLGTDRPIQIARNEYGCTDTSFVQIEVVIPVFDLAITNAGTDEVNGKLKLFVELMNKGTIIVNNPNIRIDIDERISLNQQLEGRMMPGDIKKFEIDFEVFMKNENINYICFSTEKTLGNYVDTNPYNNNQCLSIENSFTVMDPFPNPSSTFVELPIILPSTGKCDIRMVSQGGDLIFTREFKNLPSGLNVIKVDLSTYSQGMYLFTIRYGENETTKKVVIR